MLKQPQKKLTYEQIDKLSHAELKVEKLNCQNSIMAVKDMIENIDGEDDIYGENYDKLTRKLRHLKRLTLRIDLRLAEYNSIQRVVKLDESDIEKYNKVVKHFNMFNLFKPDTKYAIFHQVCHELLDENTCRVLTHKTMERLQELKQPG